MTEVHQFLSTFAGRDAIGMHTIRLRALLRNAGFPSDIYALDTPNARVTRLQQAAFIDPDHKVEYTQELLTTKLQDAGFTILESKGINYAGHSLGAGAFSRADVAGNVGTFAEGRDCYILTFLCSS